jgi:lipopolysaccharide transport system ATP-binding protein
VPLEGRRPDTLRDLVVHTARRVTARMRRPLGNSGLPSEAETLWALRGVTFEVPEGEVLGIIGPNGAGKSTLLKVLSRITDPTAGEVTLRGRVGSLLEVGTGFHAELSGRENIYLSGAILGMRREETRRRFDDIVSFAGIERFLDTPVKHYSSGMYLRLGFSVAAHLEPDILIIDEVLAVGDAEFQKKCLGKMGSVAKEGRTVVFVSHNLIAVESMCDRVIWIEDGVIRALGAPRKVIAAYLQEHVKVQTERSWTDADAAPGSDTVRLKAARIRPLHGTPPDAIDVRTPLSLEFDYWVRKGGTQLNLSVHVFNEQGILLFNAGPHEVPEVRPEGLYRDQCVIPGDLLTDGVHRVELLFVENLTLVLSRHTDLLTFDVHDSVDLRGGWHGEWAGVVRPALPWNVERLNDDSRPA